MASKSEEDWRADLLSSGVPLERLTSAALSRLGYQVLGEQTFEHNGEFHSVDLRAFRAEPVSDSNSLPAEVSLFAECKYLRRPKKLVFFSFPRPPPNIRTFSSNAIMAAGIEKLLDATTAEQWDPIEIAIVDLLAESLPAASRQCHKGVVIPRPKDKHDIFSVAKFQLSLPLMDTFVAALKGAYTLAKTATPLAPAIKAFLGPDVPELRIRLYAPVLVTNAPIFVLHEDVGLKDIETAEHIEKIADPHPFVQWITSPLGMMGKHLEGETGEFLKTFDATTVPPSFAMTVFMLFFLPRLFYVVQLEALETFVRQLEKEFIDHCRKLPRASAPAPHE